MIVYCAHNRVTGKRYFGVTTTPLCERWQAHLGRCRRGGRTVLYAAIRKYGADAFDVYEFAHLVPWLGVADLFAIEREIIAQEATKVPNGYNLTDGGEGTIGYRYTPDQRAVLCGRSCSAETREKRAASMRGRKIHGVASRAKIGAAASARNKGRAGHFVGKKFADEHKDKLRAAWTETRRAEQAARLLAVIRNRPSPRKGLTLSVAQIEKMKAAWTPERRARQSQLMAARRKAMLLAKEAA